MPGDRLDRLQEIGRLALAPRGYCAVGKRQRRIRHDQAFVEEQLHPQPVAGRAGPEGRVERKQARLDFGDGEARDRAGEFFAEGEALRLFGALIARRRRAVLRG